jgi:hypothetical protein
MPFVKAGESAKKSFQNIQEEEEEEEEDVRLSRTTTSFISR